MQIEVVGVISQAPPTATMARQVPAPEVDEHSKEVSQRGAAVRQAAPRAPSAVQVPGVVAEPPTQVAPVAQMLVTPAGSHMPPTATVATSVTESSKVPVEADALP